MVCHFLLVLVVMIARTSVISCACIKGLNHTVCQQPIFNVAIHYISYLATNNSFFFRLFVFASSSCVVRAHIYFSNMFVVKKFFFSLSFYSFYALLLLSIHKRFALTKNRLSELFLLFSQHKHTRTLHTHSNVTTKERKKAHYIASVHIDMSLCLC